MNIKIFSFLIFTFLFSLVINAGDVSRESKETLVTNFLSQGLEHPTKELPVKYTKRIRTLSWNVHKFRNVSNVEKLAKIVDELKNTEADIIGLQEVYQNYMIKSNEKAENAFEPISHEWQKKIVAELGLGEDQIKVCHGDIEKLKKNLGGAWVMEDRPKGVRVLPRQANLLISKFPIVDYECITFSEDDQFLPNGEAEPLSFIKAKIITPQGPMLVLVAHLDVYDESGITRAKQIQAMLEKVSENQSVEGKLPVMIMGDFNALNLHQLKQSPQTLIKIVKNNFKRKVKTTFHELKQVYQVGFQDVFDDPKLGTPDCSTVWSGRKVDYIFYNSFVRPIVSKILRSQQSDHYGIVSDFDLPIKSKL